MALNKQIKFGALLSYLSIFLSVVAGLIYTPWMIRQIGESDYGLYTLANSLITFFLVDFGLSSATGRFISKYIAEGKQAEAEGFLGVVYKLYLAIDAVIFTLLLLLFFSLDSIYVNLTPVELEKFKIVYAIAGLYAVINFPFVNLNGILLANEKFIHQKFADILSRFLTIGLTVISLLCNLGLYSLVAVHAIAGLITVLYKYLAIRKTTETKINFHYKNRALYRQIFSFSLWSTVTMLAQRLIFNITPTVLGITVTAATSAIAAFGIVTTLEQYTYLFSMAIKGMFMPRIARIYAAEDSEKNIMPLMIGVGRFQFAVGGLIVAGFAVIGEEFLSYWIGSSFSPEQIRNAYLGFLLVTVPGLFFNSLQIAHTALIVQNKVKLEALVTAVTGLVNIALTFFLSTTFGMVGACLSIFVAYTIRALLFHLVHHRVMGFDMALFFKRCYLNMAPPILLAGILGLILDHFLRSDTLLFLALKGGFVCLIYAVGVWLFSLSKAEQEKVLQLFSQKLFHKA